MNIIKKIIYQSIAIMALCVITASCSQEELGIRQDDMLPSGKFPLKLTASVEGMVSRAEETDSWVDGDSIRVRIGNDEKDYPWIGKYLLTSNGYVKEAIKALAWPYTDGYVKAWFPYMEEGTEVLITNQSKGVHAYDFMKARTDEMVRYSDIVNLTFKHQMAKVRCILLKGEGVTDEDLETAKVSYYGFTKATFSEAELTGDVDGWITPTDDFTALLMPQDMSGKPFIKVDLTVKVNGVDIPKSYTFTPAQGQVDLKAGSAYTFKITVQKERVVVQTVSGAWNDEKGDEDAAAIPHLVNLNITGENVPALSFSSNVKRVPEEGLPEYLLVKGKEFSISYEVTVANAMKGFIPPIEDADKVKMNCSRIDKDYSFTYKLLADTVSLVYADYPQVGDIYYSDGTWSKGLIDGKNAIGIVFKTGAADTGTTLDPNDIDKPGNYGWKDTRPIRGYVMALHDASEDPVKWWGLTVLAQNSPTIGFSAKNSGESKYSGYVNAVAAKKSTYYSELFAYQVADEYTPAATTANNESSGWYLPSIRQLKDIYELNRLKLYLKKAEGEMLIEDGNMDYWSSTEYASSATLAPNAFSFNFLTGGESVKYPKKTKLFLVRPVLTF